MLQSNVLWPHWTTVGEFDKWWHLLNSAKKCCSLKIKNCSCSMWKALSGCYFIVWVGGWPFFSTPTAHLKETSSFVHLRLLVSSKDLLLYTKLWFSLHYSFSCGPLGKSIAQLACGCLCLIMNIIIWIYREQFYLVLSNTLIWFVTTII